MAQYTTDMKLKENGSRESGTVEGEAGGVNVRWNWDEDDSFSPSFAMLAKMFETISTI